MRARTDHWLVGKISRAHCSLSCKLVTDRQHAAELGRAKNGTFKGRIPNRADSQAEIGSPLSDAGDDLRPRQRLNDNGDVGPFGAKAPDGLGHNGVTEP